MSPIPSPEAEDIVDETIKAIGRIIFVQEFQVQDAADSVLCHLILWVQISKRWLRNRALLQQQ